MRRLLMAAALLLLPGGMANADVIATGTFFSDHCTGGCGPQPGGFGTVTITDHQNGTVDFAIALLNGNKFANTGFDLSFGFNLTGNQQVTYSNLNTAQWTIAGGVGSTQNAGSHSQDGFGLFEYGLDLVGSGASGPPVTSLSFTLSGAGLSLASFAELSTNPPGNDPAYMILDIFSGTNGNTGLVDLSAQPTVQSVPGPIVGAGLPGLAAACLGLLGLARRRRKRQS